MQFFFAGKLQISIQHRKFVLGYYRSATTAILYIYIAVFCCENAQGAGESIYARHVVALMFEQFELE